jgi:hypothetical protein
MWKELKNEVGSRNAEVGKVRQKAETGVLSALIGALDYRSVGVMENHPRDLFAILAIKVETTWIFVDPN